MGADVVARMKLLEAEKRSRRTRERGSKSTSNSTRKISVFFRTPQQQATGGIELVPDWERPLLSGFVEAIEYTAAVRGAERWEP
jgi:hypothetical protein